jgi:hypothetical protein
MKTMLQSIAAATLSAGLAVGCGGTVIVTEGEAAPSPELAAGPSEGERPGEPPPASGTETPSEVVFEPDADALAIFELNGDARDTSGHERHATLLGGAFAASAWGEALVLTEDPQGFDWSSYASLLEHPYTVEMVVVTNHVDCWSKLFGWSDEADEGWYYCEGGLQDYPATPMGALLPGERHYIAFVSTSPHATDVYVNAVLVGTTATSFTAPPPAALFFRDDVVTSRAERLTGSVDAVRISSATRTPDELTAIQARLVTQPFTPSCHDGVQNQGETNIDCGGPCAGC